MVLTRWFVPGALALGTLSGCASVPADWGRSDVVQLVGGRGRELPDPADAKTFTREALTRPLTADTAIRLALLNNPALRSETARLGFAAADVYEAGRLANPVLNAARLSPDGIDLQAQFRLELVFDFVNLLFLPANTRLAKTEFEAAKLSVASAALNLATDVESTYFTAIGAEQLAQMRERIAEAAGNSAELAQRFFDAGNLTRRDLVQEQAAASQAKLDALSSRATAVEARSALNRLMGLSVTEDTWPLDARLAEPLSREDDLDALLRIAGDARLDVTAARKNAEAIAQRFGLARRTRFLEDVKVGVEREEDFDGALHVGPTVSLKLPLFNWGGGRTAAAQAALERAEAELDARVLDSGNDVKLAHARLINAKTRAEQYRSALIPQREAAVEQMQREHNYMLVGVFEVLAAKQQQYDAYAGYLGAVRDYWVARADLTRAVGTRLPSSDQQVEATLDPATLTHPNHAALSPDSH